jgi:hypothetical protein
MRRLDYWMAAWILWAAMTAPGLGQALPEWFTKNGTLKPPDLGIRDESGFFNRDSCNRRHVVTGRHGHRAESGAASLCGNLGGKPDEGIQRLFRAPPPPRFRQAGRCAKARRREGAKARRREGAKARRREGAKARRREGAKARRREDAKTRRREDAKTPGSRGETRTR